MSHEQSRTIMSTYLDEVLGKRRFDLVAELAADDMVDHTQPHLSGAAALDAHARGFCENTPDLRVEVLKIIATETSAVGIWRWDGEPHHPSAVSASGAPIIPRLVASVFEIEDGRIAEYRAFVDAVDVFTQMAQ
jgi:limonene-1,2-epoxide hydrolase